MSVVESLSPAEARALAAVVMRGLRDMVSRDGASVPAWAEPVLRELTGRADCAGSDLGTSRVMVVLSPPAATSWVGVVEAADRLGLSPEYVRRLCRSGRVRCRRIGEVWAVDVESLAGVTDRTSRRSA